jgi:hypothetical protein
VVGTRHLLGQQFKRIGAIQVISLDPQGIVTRAADLNRRSGVRNVSGRRLQLHENIRAQAFDVNVQLILGARMHGVYRQTNGTSRNAVTRHSRQSVACLPGRRKVIRRTRLLKLRTLDAGDRSDGYQQKVRPSLAIGKQRIALPFLCGAK